MNFLVTGLKRKRNTKSVEVTFTINKLEFH